MSEDHTEERENNTLTELAHIVFGTHTTPAETTNTTARTLIAPTDSVEAIDGSATVENVHFDPEGIEAFGLSRTPTNTELSGDALEELIGRAEEAVASRAQQEVRRGRGRRGFPHRDMQEATEAVYRTLYRDRSMANKFLRNVWAPNNCRVVIDHEGKRTGVYERESLPRKCYSTKSCKNFYNNDEWVTTYGPDIEMDLPAGIERHNYWFFLHSFQRRKDIQLPSYELSEGAIHREILAALEELVADLVDYENFVYEDLCVAAGYENSSQYNIKGVLAYKDLYAPYSPRVPFRINIERVARRFSLVLEAEFNISVDENDES